MWWSVVIGLAVVAVAIYAFVVLTRTMTRRLSSHSDRTAEDLYDAYADRPSRERKNKS
jgi:hypothetical protein